VNGAELAASMRDHAEKLGTKIIDKQVTRVDFSQTPFKVWTDQPKEPILAHTIIIATGSQPIKINCPGEEQYWGNGRGIFVCVKCDGHAIIDQEVVIIGGGPHALREINNVKQRTSASKITLINPNKQLTGPQFLINRAQESGIKILNNYTVKQILGDQQHVTGIEVIDNQTGKISTIKTKWVLVGLGWQPNSQEVKINNKNQIEVTSETNTSIAGVFAAGDVTSTARHQLFMASSSGFAAAMDAEKYLRNKNLI
jgi:thioredoxin reductase (NADPH)